MLMYRKDNLAVYVASEEVDNKILERYLDLVGGQLEASPLLAVQASRMRSGSDWGLAQFHDHYLPLALLVNHTLCPNPPLQEFKAAPRKFLFTLPALQLSMAEIYSLARDYVTKFYQISLSPTDHCNLTCTFCRFHSKDFTNYPEYDPIHRSKWQPRHTPFELVKSYIDQAPPNVWVNITGQGETLVVPEIVKIVKYIVSKGLQVSTITNGMLLDDKMGRELLEAGLSAITVSAEGYDQATYSRYRQGGDFDKVIKNIEILKKNIAEINPEVSLAVNSVLPVDMMPYKEKILSFWKDKVDCLTFFCELKPDLKVQKYFTPLPEFPYCWELFNGPQLLSNGQLSPCCAVSNRVWYEDINWLLSLEDYSLAEICQQYRKMFFDETSQFAKFCSTCPYKPFSYFYKGRSPIWEIVRFNGK